MAARIAHIGHWEKNLVTGEEVWSDELYRLYQIEPDSQLPIFKNFLNMVHPDDREGLKSSIQAAVTTWKEVSHLFRFILPDSTERLMETTCKVLLDEKAR